LANKPRIILYDIETTHNIVATFRLFGEDYIPHDNLLQERYIVCAAWKELGEKRVHAVSTLDDPARFKRNPHDDRHVVQTLNKVLSEADFVVAHNGRKYDDKFLRGRSIHHKLPPLTPFKSIDTYLLAKKHFLFNSNRLDYLGQYLGVGKKVKTSPGLWLRVLQGDKKAIDEMVRYNKQDVRLLEDVFNVLRPYDTQINMALANHADGACTHCGSGHTQRRGYALAATRAYQRFQCQDCGGWFKTGKAEGVTASRSL
jgi:hypothetical protein